MFPLTTALGKDGRSPRPNGGAEKKWFLFFHIGPVVRGRGAFSPPHAGKIISRSAGAWGSQAEQGFRFKTPNGAASRADPRKISCARPPGGTVWQAQFVLFPLFFAKSWFQHRPHTKKRAGGREEKAGQREGFFGGEFWGPINSPGRPPPRQKEKNRPRRAVGPFGGAHRTSGSSR